MSFHRQIIADTQIVPEAGAVLHVQKRALCGQADDRFETVFNLIRQTTGATHISAQFTGDAPQPVLAGQECIEAPLLQNAQRIGTLRAYAPAFAPTAASILNSFAALIVEQAALWTEAHRDALTGAMTRRAFADDLTRAVAACRRNGSDYSLIMFDLDEFKAINDNFGHVAGDAVLRAVGHAVQAELRLEDRFGRLGGEEFGVLVAAGADAALEIAERLRVVIARSVAPTFPEINFTASLGVATCEIGIDTVDALMARADAQLYAAKASGRNIVCAPSMAAQKRVVN
ncbi:GGDEF domain-containing protein [Roseinatronobacter alkalisoli]|uniref:diguanylate cyclase n=1 Tax=Roseinatronobacter alkalisoli TaxID=3028235 RepID=A0ABT5T8F4_9RHOB|nr:GGDEF domain-containing protein [Roseinatronobacter sp. HJB301]MDD7971239.1 GGDEF domain-containing protein [Roseinatronobacter sp. HJB301]